MLSKFYSFLKYFMIVVNIYWLSLMAIRIPNQNYCCNENQ